MCSVPQVPTCSACCQWLVQQQRDQGVRDQHQRQAALPLQDPLAWRVSLPWGLFLGLLRATLGLPGSQECTMPQAWLLLWLEQGSMPLLGLQGQQILLLLGQTGYSSRAT